jgi:hypothetical protein
MLPASTATSGMNSSNTFARYLVHFFGSLHAFIYPVSPLNLSWWIDSRGVTYLGSLRAQFVRNIDLEVL